LFIGLSVPALLTIFVVVFVPIFWLSSLSLVDRSGTLTIENYARILESELYTSTFIVTFQISVAVTAVCVLLGYPLSYWLCQLPARLAGILLIFVLLPFWTSVLVRTYAWLVLLQRNGIINQSMMSLGLIEAPLQLAHNLTGSIIGMVHIMLPFLVLPLYASMRSIDGDLVRAAIGFSSPREAFWRVFADVLAGVAPRHRPCICSVAWVLRDSRCLAPRSDAAQRISRHCSLPVRGCSASASSCWPSWF
jgi:ABC-type spermidine/putrescine transport system permease subunit I